MLAKSLRSNPWLVVFLGFCFFLGWQLSRGDRLIDHASSPGKAPAKGSFHPPPAADGTAPLTETSKPKKPRIALLTFITNQNSYLHIALRSKDHYARRHGYGFIVDFESHAERGTTWWKHDMVEREVKSGKWDWVWFMDFDTLITNTDIKVADIIEETLRNVTKPDEVDFLITNDCNGLNSGSYIVRGHERSVKFIHDIYAVWEKRDPDEHMGEQDAMAKLIETNKAARDRTVRVPQWKLNAFPPEIACFDESQKVWEHGTFLLHFAGAWAHVKSDDATGDLMKKYEPEIIWGDWKEVYSA